MQRADQNGERHVPTAPEARESSRGRGEAVGFWVYALHLLSVGGIAASNSVLGLSVLASPWSIRATVKRLKGYRSVRYLLAATGAYLGVLLLSIVFSFDPKISVRALSEVFSLLTLPLALVWVRSLDRLRWLVDLMIAVGALFALHGLGQLLVGYGDLDLRIRGPFSHWMTFAGALLIVFMLLVGRLAADRSSRRWWRWAILVTILVAIVASLTRGVWVALLLTGGLFLVLRVRRWWLVALPLLVLFLTFAPVAVLQRGASIFDLGDASNYDRLCMLEAGVDMVAERPVFGIGPDMVSRRYPIYRHPSAPRFTVPHLHNSFLELAAERGLAGLFAYLGLVAVALWTARRRLRTGLAAPGADLALGASLAILAFNLAGLFENNWGDTEVQRLMLFVLAVPALSALPSGSRPVGAAARAAVEGPGQIGGQVSSGVLAGGADAAGSNDSAP